MTKVVRIITRLNVGGPAIHVLWLNHLLDRRGYSSLLVSGRESSREGNMLALAERLSVEPISVPSLQREVSLLSDLAAIWRLTRILRRQKPQIVHTHTAKAGTLGRIAAWLARVPVRVHTHHGHTLYGYFPSWKTRLFTSVEKLLGRITTHLVTVSPQVRNDLIAAGITSPDHITVIPLGLDLDPLAVLDERKGFRKQLGLSPTTPLIGIVARLVPVKGHVHLLQAVRRLFEKGSQFAVAIVGDGELGAELRREVRKSGLEERVIFAGFVEEMADVYADLDVLVLSSLNEGLPVAAIEALASGIPIVSTRVGGVPDLLDGVDSAIMVPPADPPALAHALETVLEGLPAYKEMAQKHRPRTREQFSLERLAENVDGLYRRLGGMVERS